MTDIYKPGWQSREYHRRPRADRDEIADKVNKLFAEKTGVTRKLDPTSKADLNLRRIWLRLRDEVIEETTAEEDMEFRRQMFLDDLPGIVIEDMLSMGWTDGAQLLETWSKRPPSVAPKYSAAVTDVIRMDWVLTFSRAKSVYDKILSDKIWTNEASQKRIGEALKKNPRGAGGPFGSLFRPVTEVDREWINSRPVTGGLSFDALAGALGAFYLQVAVSGTVLSVSATAAEVSIGEVGIYAKDGFHFNDNDFLGFWGYRDDPVNDSDFRLWRSQNNLGGDFEVFSDIKHVKLTTPDRVQAKM